MSKRSDQVRAIFGVNLTELVKRERSIADLARRLDVNRTQLHRFMSGEAFPRPDVLLQICEHFGVDARILTTPLALIKTDARARAGLDEYFDPVFAPVSPDLLPDGLYNEWKFSVSHPGMISQHLLLVHSRGNQRFSKLRALAPATVDEIKFRYQPPLNLFIGQIFAQRNGFAIIDRTASQRVIAMTAFRVGYSINDDIYPGYKLAGASYNRQLLHAHSAVLLQRIPRTTKDYLAAGRMSQYRSEESTPLLIRNVLTELRDEASGRPPAPVGAPYNAHGGVAD